MEDLLKTLAEESAKLEAKLRALVDPLIEKMGKNDASLEEIKATGEKYKALQEQLDALDVKLQKAEASKPGETLGEKVENLVKSQDIVGQWKSKKLAHLDLKGLDLMQTKVAGTVTRVTDTIQPQFTGLQYVPGRRLHIRDLLPIGTTTSSQIWMPYESATTNGIARTAEGAVKPQSDFTPSVVKWAIEKVATFIKFSEEILEDMPQFTSYITTRWIELLKQAEDTKLLYGTGSSDIKGLTVSGAAYVDVLASSAVDRWMVLDAATTQVQAANFTPNYILLHPTTAMQLRQERSTTKEFIVNPFAPMQINGCTIVPHPAMVAGDFLVGDFGMGAQVWDRVAANIKFYDQDGDNAQYNLITAVIEERLALVTYQSTAFCFGAFADALAKGSA